MCTGGPTTYILYLLLLAVLTRWEMRMDPNGDVYYVALDTDEQKRQHPLDHAYRHAFLEAKYGSQPGGDYLVLLVRVRVRF